MGDGRRKTELDDGDDLTTTQAPKGARRRTNTEDMVKGYDAGGASGGRRDTVNEGSSDGGNSGSKRKRKDTILDDDEEFKPGPAEGKGDSRRRIIGWMVSFDFTRAGQEYVLREGRTTIGQGRENDVSLFYDDQTSGAHCEIISRPRGGLCAIIDLRSTNGTHVNGEDIGIGGQRDLQSGDVLRIGKSRFKAFLLSKDDIESLWSNE